MVAPLRLTALARPVVILALVLAAFGLLAPAASANKLGGVRPPDLVIQNIASGYGAGGWYVDVVVKNQGGDAGSFYVKQGNLTRWVPSLPANSTTSVRFGVWDCPSGSITAMADAYQQVPELYEWNNSRTVYMLC